MIALTVSTEICEASPVTELISKYLAWDCRVALELGNLEQRRYSILIWVRITKGRRLGATLIQSHLRSAGLSKLWAKWETSGCTWTYLTFLSFFFQIAMLLWTCNWQLGLREGVINHCISHNHQHSSQVPKLPVTKKTSRKKKSCS